MWPQILNWATRPVSAAIESLWEAHQSRPNGIGAEWDDIELVCLLERLLVFAQTGNGQVINGALSEAFGLKHSLETTGFPTFSSALDTNRSTPKIRQGYWPTRGPDNQAVTCANASIRYYYNESVSQVRDMAAPACLPPDMDCGYLCLESYRESNPWPPAPARTNFFS